MVWLGTGQFQWSIGTDGTIGTNGKAPYSNGSMVQWCNPEIISRWILLAQSRASSQATAKKRARQIQFVNDNVDSKRHQWLVYYDLDYSKLLYLKGLPRQTPRQQ